ncbi:sulfite reductase, ferredoxin dependent [Tumidithrix elongata RA019]|uniref:Sulfite reductase, ferredoxin dependent n=1 Tax=Tumidithrix elongata BACA0141 TaxID=2716417 RepID=A0AAW9PTK7_9CYAN|nr:sulfite reductase, ferredoxin dependent [Tumidithrix elongata RA019]
MTNTVKVSKVEILKQKSNFLRGPIDAELTDGNSFFSQDGTQILKFHGSYQQKERDLDRAKAKGEEPNYSMMLRTRSPGGFIPWQLYITLDQLSEKYGNQTLRATTRQGFQIHGILKQNLKTVIADIVHSMGSTVGACGDINRNVMAPPAPFKHKPEYVFAREYAVKIADLLAPQAGAYYDVWLDGEKALTSEDPEVTEARNRAGKGKVNTNIENNPEPIYGTQYMPRKFKIAIAVPGDNSVDLFTNDLSLVVITNEQQELEGFNLYVGGGLGRSHNNDATIVRLADSLGFVPLAEIYDVIKAVVALERDYGDRHNRRHARIKYLLNDWGVEKFTQILQDYYPTPLQPAKPLPEFEYKDYLGWHEQGDGKYFVGISIENGRILDREGLKLKTALREITEHFHLPMYLTPNHNLLLCEVEPDLKAKIQSILDQYGILSPEAIDPLTRYSMACPAFPTCGLAITESERILPSVIERIRALLEKLDLGDQKFVTRMTGCPNGCARPYMAELGLVGSADKEYQVWLGGSFNSTRLAQPYVQRLHIDKLESGLEPLFVYFKRDRLEGEGFGDFCDRKGIADLQAFSASYVPEISESDEKPKSKSSKPKDQRHRVNLSTNIYEQLQQASASRGKSMKEIVEAAIALYLQQE